MKDKEYLLTAALALAAVVLVACGPLRGGEGVAPGGEAYDLEGTPWVLQAYLNGEDVLVQALPSSRAMAAFQGGEVTGNASCNHFFGAYEVKGNKLSVELSGVTEMYCMPEELMDQEADFLAALDSAASYRILADKLQIEDSRGNPVLEFSVLQPTPLVGTTWQLTGYNNGQQAVVSVVIGTEITAVFQEDGKVNGSAGCNNYTASYEVEGDAISMGPAASTRMFCAEPEGIMEQETAYLTALGWAEVYQIEGDRLQIRDAKGSLIVDYVAKMEVEGLGEEVLQNMDYKSDFTRSGVAPLTDGEYREQAAPGSATETVVQLTDHLAYGLLDGEEAAAVILVTDPGGSGTFYDLAVVVERDGQPVNIATAFLGDRVQVDSLIVEAGLIIVEMIQHGPDDPMCCPTQRVQQRYLLEGEELIQTASDVIQ